jgi:hypothetical protein
MALRAAIDRYSECLATPGRDEKLAGDAQYNRARARLLLLQAPAPQNGAEQGQDEPKKDDEEEPKKDDKTQQQKAEAPKDGDQKASKADGKEQAKEGPEGKKGDEHAGKGRPLVTPPSESPEAPPLAREDAERQLAEAVRRIREESAAFRRSQAKPPRPGVTDW